MKGTTNLVALLATSSFQLSYAGPVPESSVLQPRDDDPEFEYPGLLAKVMPDGMAPGACAEKNGKLKFMCALGSKHYASQISIP